MAVPTEFSSLEIIGAGVSRYCSCEAERQNQLQLLKWCSSEHTRNVSFWHLADINPCSENVCF
jgi:hypothetical protein